MKKTIAIIGIITLVVVASVYLINKDINKTTLEGNILRVGYIVYPPSLKKDPKTGQFSGFSYDIVETIAKKLGMKTEWTEEVGWGTAIEGLKTERYNVLGTQMWPTEEREAAVLFSISPMDSVSYAYTRKGDTRFDNDLSILNSEEYTISTLDGEITASIAKEDFPNAKTLALPQLSSYAEIFLNVVQNKADITFAELSSMEDFLATNPNTLERVNDEPIRAFGNSFAFNKKDTKLVKKWNEAIQELLDEGEIKRILEKYGVENYYRIN